MEHMGKKERVRAEWGSHCQTSSGKSFLMIHLKFGPKILKVWVKCSCLESILHFSQLSHCCGGAMDTWWRKPIGTAGIPLGHHPYSTNVHSFLAQLHQCTRLLLFWRRVSKYLPRVSLKILLLLFLHLLRKCLCNKMVGAQGLCVVTGWSLCWIPNGLFVSHDLTADRVGCCTTCNAKKWQQYSFSS